jgi:hypothetical protein
MASRTLRTGYRRQITGAIPATCFIKVPFLTLIAKTFCFCIMTFLGVGSCICSKGRQRQALTQRTNSQQKLNDNDCEPLSASQPGAAIGFHVGNIFLKWKQRFSVAITTRGTTQ